ncbi:MAG: hypothetical protein U0R78_15715 [Nocardioidaceae bacterium]
MTSEPRQDQAFQRLLDQYFPRDAVRIREDVRVADSEHPRASDFDTDFALTTFLTTRT